MISADQYTARVAAFFDKLQVATGRKDRYSNYIAAWIAARESATGHQKRNVLVTDFGCGTGWLLSSLIQNGTAAQGIGYDPSKEMLRIAAGNNSQIIANGRLRLTDTVRGTTPSEKSDYVISTQVTHHFTDAADMTTNMFGPIRSLLKEDGELIVITAHPDHIHNTPDNWSNSVRIKDLSDEIRKKLPDYSIVTKGPEKYVRLSNLATHCGVDAVRKIMQDGTPMHVEFFIRNGRAQYSEVTDHHHPLSSIIESAKAAGFELLRQPTDLYQAGHPAPTEVALHFKPKQTEMVL